MKTYVMSDIHGCLDKFQKMLEKIEFTEQDQLIIAGDYIDRGVQSLEMLQWIEKAPDNVLLLKGNHDVEFAMCVNLMCQVIANNDLRIANIDKRTLKEVYAFLANKISGDGFDYYGTIKKLIEECDVSIQDFKRWQQIIDEMPYYFKLRVDGILHVIVHAGYMTDPKMELRNKEKYPEKELFYIYAREDAYKDGGLKNAVIIAGHTPTIMGGKFGSGGNIFKYRNTINHVTYYDIDCGAAYWSEKFPHAKLACMRLEDKKEFYV